MKVWNAIHKAKHKQLHWIKVLSAGYRKKTK